MTDDDTTKAETIGTLNPGREGRVVDPVTGVLYAPGTAGELWVRSAMTMSGYFRDACEPNVEYLGDACERSVEYLPDACEPNAGGPDDGLDPTDGCTPAISSR